MCSQVAVVIDAGSETTKAGFANESFPRADFPTVVGRFRSTNLLDGFPEVYCGKEAIRNRGVSTLTWPVRHGEIQDWDEIEKLWHYIFYKELLVPPEEAHVMHAVHPLIADKDKEKMAEILFESFAVSGIYLAKAPCLALHANGLTTGLVWESGAGCAHATPVFEGFPLNQAIITSPLTGNAVTNVFQELLAKSGFSFTTPIERDLLNKMKADYCYVSQNFEEEIAGGDHSVRFCLPDGQEILIGEQRFNCTELLFKPNLYSYNCPNVVETIISSINKCDTDIRPTLYENIIISGGSCMIPGFEKRLLAELREKSRHIPYIKPDVHSLNARQMSVWSGGSILASMSTLKHFWISQKEYADVGVDIVNHKFF